MGTVALKIRNDKERFELQKGEAIEYEDKKGKRIGLVIACPQCGYPATGTHRWDPKTKTLTPSLICGAEGCNYHGHLKNGIFDKVN